MENGLDAIVLWSFFVARCFRCRSSFYLPYGAIGGAACWLRRPDA